MTEFHEELEQWFVRGVADRWQQGMKRSPLKQTAKGGAARDHCGETWKQHP
jgi:hypothetical protein